MRLSRFCLLRGKQWTDYVILSVLLFVTMQLTW